MKNPLLSCNTHSSRDVTCFAASFPATGISNHFATKDRISCASSSTTPPMRLQMRQSTAGEMQETAQGARDRRSTITEVVVHDFCTFCRSPPITDLLILSIMIPIASLSDSALAIPRRSQRPIINHLEAWLKNDERQDNACVVQSIIDHATEVERNKAVRLAMEEGV